MRFCSRWISPTNNVFDKYEDSDSIERNNWHKITLLTYYSQVNNKEAERRHQKNVHRLPPFLSLPPPPPPAPPLRSLFTGYFISAVNKIESHTCAFDKKM